MIVPKENMYKLNAGEMVLILVLSSGLSGSQSLELNCNDSLGLKSISTININLSDAANTWFVAGNMNIARISLLRVAMPHWHLDTAPQLNL